MPRGFIVRPFHDLSQTGYNESWLNHNHVFKPVIKSHNNTTVSNYQMSYCKQPENITLVRQKQLTGFSEDCVFIRVKCLCNRLGRNEDMLKRFFEVFQFDYQTIERMDSKEM